MFLYLNGYHFVTRSTTTVEFLNNLPILMINYFFNQFIVLQSRSLSLLLLNIVLSLKCCQDVIRFFYGDVRVMFNKKKII